MKARPYPYEKRFAPFRRHIIGIADKAPTFLGSQKMIYADWITSGRMYWPIEEKFIHKVYPWVANPLSHASIGGDISKKVFAQVKGLIHKHLNARNHDRVLPLGPNNLRPLEAFKHILGMGYVDDGTDVRDKLHKGPLVFLTPGEHPQTYRIWEKTYTEIQMIPTHSNGAVAMEAFESMLQNVSNPQMLVVINACCEFTGNRFPYHSLAGLAHRYGAMVLVDFTTSAPYVDINMHPNDTEYLDAVLFSPQTFLGGPGGAAVLVFNENLIQLFSEKLVVNSAGISWKEDLPNTVDQIAQWNTDMVSVIRTGMAIELKESMGTHWMQQRIRGINSRVYEQLYGISGLCLLGGGDHDGLPVFCFALEGIHHELVVRLLADRFGIQASWVYAKEGYGPLEGATEFKGWTRVSFHPTTSNQEVLQVCYAIETIAAKGREWSKGYHRGDEGLEPKSPMGKALHTMVEDWFTLQRPQAHDNRF